MTSNTTESRKPTPESRLDKMIADSFPASDPPQLDGRDHDPSDTTPSDAQSGVSPNNALGNDTPASADDLGPKTGLTEETIPIGDQGVITLRFVGEPPHLELSVEPQSGVTLVSGDVDTLVRALHCKLSELLKQTPVTAA